MGPPEQIFAKGNAISAVPDFIPDAADENGDAAARQNQRQNLSFPDRQCRLLRPAQVRRQRADEQMPESQDEGANDQEEQARLQPEQAEVAIGRDAAPDGEGDKYDDARDCGQRPAESVVGPAHARSAENDFR